MTLSKIRASLKKAGYKPEKRFSASMVKGYRPVYEPGYRLKERKEQNPDWYGFRKLNPPRWIETGIFEVSHTDKEKLPALLEVIEAAGFEAKSDGDKIIIDTNGKADG